MITLEQKKFEEIEKMTKGYSRLLVLGCETCSAMSFAGGQRQVEELASAIRMAQKTSGQEGEVLEDAIARQCEPEFVDLIRDKLAGCDAVLSLACGAGVQLLAERFPDKVILPGCNTTFLGVTEELGVWSERCAGCGNCILDKTAGLCPIARCSKQLLNGPCGGSMNGKCEISKDVDCVWQLIIDRLARLNRLEMLEEIFPVKDWSPAGHGGPRKMVREDLKS
ncbi:MAG: methylenetetrahydrofolate reductase C-terminal domain-containing protein [Deltaproteobacteria bacterium]|nr:methylenetetrahydrofolate reductase C-terminal domain-containing protein [Deltaproteobacteria bacterium]MBW2073353.1 methylenetetrahydrofolate reductase C-terminal domain-containing protein [Deltaproteobacteria bacterium]